MNQIVPMRPCAASPSAMSRREELEAIEASLSRASSLHDGTDLLSAETCQRYLDETAERELRCTPDVAIKALTNITGVYPKSSIADPSIWAAAATAILMEFPASVVQRCGHPVTGIVRTAKFTPVPAEIAAWCDAERTRQRALRYRASWMLKERARREAEAPRI